MALCYIISKSPSLLRSNRLSKTVRNFHHPSLALFAANQTCLKQFDQNRRCYSSGQPSDEILVKTENKVLTMTLNRPKRYNALTKEMYERITEVFSEAAENDSVSIVKITGAGKYYCSGNDLSMFAGMTPSTMKQLALDAADLLERFVAGFIDFPKPLIASVNGPTIGIPVSLLPLFDAVYASDEATFLTPFARTGQSMEACSSYTFPKLMGQSKASSMLLFGETLSAVEAERLFLVSKVFPASTFQNDVDREIENIVQLPIKSLVYMKRLMRDGERELLHKVNKAECERLTERWASEDCISSMMKFLSKS